MRSLNWPFYDLTWEHRTHVDSMHDHRVRYKTKRNDLKVGGGCGRHPSTGPDSRRGLTPAAAVVGVASRDLDVHLKKRWGCVDWFQSGFLFAMGSKGVCNMWPESKGVSRLPHNNYNKLSCRIVDFKCQLKLAPHALEGRKSQSLSLSPTANYIMSKSMNSISNTRSHCFL